MMKRCYIASSNNYHIYGGKGIKVCDEWHTFENFLSWAMDSGYEDHLTIDRIDSNKDYCPKNCRWITLSENIGRSSTRDNFGKNKLIKLSQDHLNEISHLLENKICTQTEAARRYGVHQSTISKALRK